ncbi:MAG: hypothetical protein HN627_05035 [Opitutae bacterium]|nr:hypothetical protein [Opitutae bacterium]
MGEFLDNTALEWPLRMDDLDGPTIRDYRQRSFRAPLLFPVPFDPFARIDAGDSSFISLRSLRSNPSLAGKFPRKLPKVFGIVDLESIKKMPSASVATTSPSSELAERVRKIEQQLLGTVTPKVARPGDDQLAAFLDEDYVTLHEQAEELANLLEKLSTKPSEIKRLVQAVPSPKLSDVLVPVPPTRPLLPNLRGSAFRSQDNLPPTAERTLSDLGFKAEGRSASPLGSILKLSANVDLPGGGVRPAQASEFYVTTRNVQELLSQLKLQDAVAAEVSTLVDLWGRSEKDKTAYPEIALGVKSILLEAKVRRTRTDPYGKAAVAGLSPDEKYFLIGVDKDLETDVVTIWSKEVKVNPGENEVELTAKDVIFSK